MNLPDNRFFSACLLFVFLQASCGHAIGSMSENFDQLLNKEKGLISVWLKSGSIPDDGLQHEIWSTREFKGTRLLLEKSGMGKLRAVLTTPTGTTVARTDIMDWKKEDWHFVSVSWTKNEGSGTQDQQVGGSLVLWVDKVAKDGPVVPNDFSISRESLSFRPNLIPILSEDSKLGTGAWGEAARYGQVASVYRDYFRTAPFDAIKIDIESTRVPSDSRAVAGFEKQFGLLARLNNRWEPVTENVVRYSQWAYFDAKPYITWSTSDPAIATIDSTGRLKVVKPGKCRVIAEFQGRTDSYRLSVTGPEKPDAGIICISLTPRYRIDALKNGPAPGDTITAGLHFGNFGTSPLPAGMKIRFTLISETTGNYRLDQKDRPIKIGNITTDKELQSGEESVIQVEFVYPATPAWMKLELDPGDRIDEFCEANNSIAELTDARPIQLGFRRKDLESCLANRKINHVGSLSYYDWLRSEKLRMDVMLREAVWPTTGPNGVEEAYRIDTYTELLGGDWDNEPWNQEANWYDGGFPVNEDINLMSIDCAIIHEFGHTILSQPDLYGYPVKASNVFVKEDDGRPVAGSPSMPVVRSPELMPASGGINVAGYGGYPSLMDGCQLWLHPSQAGHIMYYKKFRQDRFWGTQGRLIPGRANWLVCKDINDRPLKGAAVYVYHVSQAPVEDSGEKYFSNRPKFTGRTDDDGRFLFPNMTDSLWDDPETDEVEGSIEVWNPFGTKVRETAFTPNVWSVEGLLLIRVVSDNQSEYHFMDLTQFNSEFLSGHMVEGSYVLNTSLASPKKPTNRICEPVPEAIRKINKRPVAVVAPFINVKAGEEFVIDGSRSFDPEGQPLIYRWNAADGWLRGNVSQSATLKLKAPNKPGIAEYKFWVIDGIRCSEPARIKVHVL